MVVAQSHTIDTLITGLPRRRNGMLKCTQSESRSLPDVLIVLSLPTPLSQPPHPLMPFQTCRPSSARGMYTVFDMRHANVRARQTRHGEAWSTGLKTNETWNPKQPSKWADIMPVQVRKGTLGLTQQPLQLQHHCCIPHNTMHCKWSVASQSMREPGTMKSRSVRGSRMTGRVR